VVEQQQQGLNIIREMGGGVSVTVRRPLLAEPLPLPPISTAVTVQKLKASLLDSEYTLILAVLATNFGEAAEVPPAIAWLHQHLLADPLAAAEAAENAHATAAGAGAAAAAPAVDSLKENVAATSAAGDAGSASDSGSAAQAAASATPAAPGTTMDADLRQQVACNFTATNSSLLSLLADMPTVKTSVSIGQAQLMLWNAQPEGLPPAAVGSVEFSDLWLVLHLTQAGNMLLSLSLPNVCARDLRPGVPKEASLVLSTAEIGSAAHLGGPLSGTGAAPLPDAGLKSRSTAQASSTDSCSDGSPLLPSLLTLDYRMITSGGPQPVSALQVGLPNCVPVNIMPACWWKESNSSIMRSLLACLGHDSASPNCVCLHS